MINSEFFFENVTKELQKQKTNYEWLCKSTGLNKGTMANWKSLGRLPRVDEALRIAKALNVSLDSLIDPEYVKLTSGTDTATNDDEQKGGNNSLLQSELKQFDYLPLPLKNLLKRFLTLPMEWQMIIMQNAERITEAVLRGENGKIDGES